jgi:hypothetical protein
LAAKNLSGENVAGNQHCEIDIRIQFGGEIAGEVCCQPTARDLPRERDIAPGAD